MRLAWLCALAFIFRLEVEAKPRFRKQKRTVETVSRNLLNQYENKQIFSDNDVMKQRFKGMVESLPQELKKKATDELLFMFGLEVPNNIENLEYSKKPPKYMVDLYNAIADRNGITRAPDLLDADTVRSIPNKGTLCPGRCHFDLPVLNEKEKIVDAELHIFVEQPKRIISPKTNYFVKIFQIFSEENGKNGRTLVAARRLPSHVHGWQIFPLLTTVESWSRGSSDNFGITIETTMEDGDVIKQRLSAKGKQPILVIFTNDNKNVADTKKKTNIKTLQLLHKAKMSEVYQENGHQRNSRHKRSADDVTGEKESRRLNSKSRKTRRNKKLSHKSNRDYEGESKVPKSEVESNQTKSATSEEKTESDKKEGSYRDYSAGYDSGYNGEKDDDAIYFDESDFWHYDYDYASDSGSSKSSSSSAQSRHPVGSSSSARFPSFSTLSTTSSAARSCRRYPLYVDFEEMGWSGWIIHPQGYNAYHCRGKCDFPLGQNLKPSNHATVQSIMHTLGLGGQPVDQPCCTPDKLYDINLLYFDHNDYVVLRRYKDMVAASCACR